MPTSASEQLPVILQEADAGSQAADASRMRDVMSRCGALGSERARTTFKVNNLEQDLARLLKSGNVEQHRDVLERKLASAALAGPATRLERVLQHCSVAEMLGWSLLSG